MKYLLRFTFIFILFSSQGQSTDVSTFFRGDWEKAEIYYQKGAYKNAIELYERVLEKHPGEKRAILRAAESYIQLNEPEKALNYYESVIDSPNL